MRKAVLILFVVSAVALYAEPSGDRALFQGKPQVSVAVTSALDAPRPQQTVELAWRDLLAKLPEAKPESVAVFDEATGSSVTSQVLDENGDGKPELLLWQTDFAPRQTKTFIVAANIDRKKLPVPAVTTTVRVSPEHFDDYAWESDRIAFRIYSQKLWKQTPGGTGSGVDVWCKHVRQAVVEHMYRRDYHKDDGIGVDAYLVGTGRGCGGTAVWAKDRMWTGQCYETGKIIATGPIRAVFELTYGAWDAAGRQVSEVKRISLDLGSNFNRFDCRWTAAGDAPLTIAAGVKLHGGAQLEQDGDWAAVWEPADGKVNGHIGVAVIVPGGAYRKAEGHALFTQPVTPGATMSFYAGAGWSKGLDYPDQAAWTAAVRTWSARLASPLRLQVGK